jgi:hypothetical protein
MTNEQTAVGGGPTAGVNCLPFRDDGDFASLSLVDTLRGHLGVIAQAQVNDAAFVRGHGLQGHRAVGAYGLLRHPFGQVAQRFFPTRLKAFHVYRQSHLLCQSLSDAQLGDELQRGQRFSAAANQCADVWTLDVEHEMWFFI